MLLIFVASLRVSAQFQELEQLKLNLEKLAQFKMMLSEMKRGYQTLQNGYNSVRDVSRGNFDLHKSYLDGLWQVNTAVKNSPALTQIFSNQSRLLQEYKTSYQRIVSCNLFSVKELADIKASYQVIIEQVASDFDVLDMVLAPGKLRMNDAERISVVEKVNAGVKANLELLRTITSDHARLMALRSQRKRDTDAMRRLNGLK